MSESEFESMAREGESCVLDVDAFLRVGSWVENWFILSTYFGEGTDSAVFN